MMNNRISGCIVGAFVAGLALLPVCSGQPAPRAAGPRPVDISQIPPLQTAPVGVESAFASGWSRTPPSAADLAYHSMLLGTEGMAPGTVAGGPKERLAAGGMQPAPRLPQPRPKLVLPSLQPGAVLVQTEGGEAWKKSLSPLPHLDAK